MIFLIPISNFIISTVIKLDKVILIPNQYFEKTNLEYDAKLSTKQIGIIKYTMNLYKEEYLKGRFFKYTLAMFESPFSEEEYDGGGDLEDEFILLEKICDIVNRAMNYILLCYCDITNPSIIPGIPGIIDGFRSGYVLDINSPRRRSVLGKVYSISFQYEEGEGLSIDKIPHSVYNVSMYKYLFSNRNDELYLNCRTALMRVCEAMYMNNYNISFVYLMSTLDMLDPVNYNFDKIKSHILPFISDSKNKYFTLGKELKFISENIRTEIIHNGKNIYDLVDNENEIYNILRKITECIVCYCNEVLLTGIQSFEDLKTEKKRLQRILKL